MLLVHKYHAVLIVNGFRAYIPARWMAYWAIHCRKRGLMVRRI
jgi:hypothetical protein